MHTIISPVWNLQKDTPTIYSIFFGWDPHFFFKSFQNKQEEASQVDNNQEKGTPLTKKKKKKEKKHPPKSCGDNNKKRLDSFQYF